MIVYAWVTAGVFFCLWTIEHVGGAEARAELRRLLEEARRDG